MMFGDATSRKSIPWLWRRKRWKAPSWTIPIKFNDLPIKTMKLIEAKAAEGIYLCLSPGTILISERRDLKLFDLRSHLTGLNLSYDNLYSTVKQVVQKVKDLKGIDGISAEVDGFSTCSNMPMGLDMCMHPALLLSKEKLDFFHRFFDAYKSAPLSSLSFIKKLKY